MLKFESIKEEFEYPDAKAIQFMEQEVLVKQFLPTDKKYGLIYICLMSLNLKEQVYNPLIAETLFDLEVVKEYSNIDFGEQETDSYFKQFDILQVSGIMELIIENIPQQEFEELQRLYEECIAAEIEYSGNFIRSIGGLINNISNLDSELEDVDTEVLEKGIEMVTKLSKENHI